MIRALTLAGAMLAVGIAATVAATTGGDTQPDTPPHAQRASGPHASEPRADEPQPARGRLAPTAETAVAAADHSREVLLPDGSYVPALNDAVDAAPLHEYWGPRPWSPIVAVERNDAGVDWYRHANGSYSTTQMVMRSDLGRLAALTRVAHIGQAPAAPAPPRKASK